MGDKAKVLAVPVIAIVCCISVPVIAGLLGASFAASEWGEAGFALVVLATTGVVWWRLRKRRSIDGCADGAAKESNLPAQSATPRRF